MPAEHMPLVKNIETTPDASPLVSISYGAVLRWAADDNGKLRRSKLKQAAKARGYKRGWVRHNAGRHWKNVLAESKQWRAKKSKQELEGSIC
jgi:hypothetical protein